MNKKEQQEERRIFVKLIELSKRSHNPSRKKGDQKNYRTTKLNKNHSSNEEAKPIKNTFYHVRLQ
jgi:hypothetical protein